MMTFNWDRKIANLSAVLLVESQKVFSIVPGSVPKLRSPASRDEKEEEEDLQESFDD